MDALIQADSEPHHAFARFDPTGTAHPAPAARQLATAPDLLTPQLGTFTFYRGLRHRRRKNGRIAATKPPDFNLTQGQHADPTGKYPMIVSIPEKIHLWL